jgi:type IV secretory pathway TrbL component
MTRTHAPLALLMAAFLILVACTASQIVADLQIGLEAVTALLPMIAGAAGAPASVTDSVLAYATAANSAFGQADTILLGNGTNAAKTAQIVALFADVEAPVVPAQYSALASQVALIATDVAKFIAALPAATPAAARAQPSSAPTQLSASDQQKLVAAQKVAASNAAALKNMVK